MTICYSYLLSLLFLLLMIHSTDTASLRSFIRSSPKWSLDRRYSPSIIHNEYTTLEPVLSRRRPPLLPTERRRRWLKEVDNDEIEIPIDETNFNQLPNKNKPTVNNSADTFLFNSTFHSNKTQGSNSTVLSALFDYTTIVTGSVEDFTIASTVAEVNHPLLRQDIIELVNTTEEQTTVSINDEILQDNKTDITTIANEQSIENDTNLITTSPTVSNEINSTESEILPTNVTDINQVLPNEKNESVSDTIDNLTTTEIISNENYTSAMPLSINETSNVSQTVTEINQNTAISLLDYTTISSNIIDDNQTLIDSTTIDIINPTIPSEFNTTITNEGIDTTAILNVTQNSPVLIVDTTSISDLIQNDTATIIFDEDEYLNETSTLTTKPACDHSCQCSKKCPFGFEILNDTCQCDPPCKNYQCFGNDTCTVTNKGQPLCQPENGTKHDRPISCYQPRVAGYHDASTRYHQRWYYHPDEDTCHLFVYRGLGGNGNNFQTLHECHIECITCAPLPDPGACLGRIRMWYYDYKKGECSQFDYSGCKGNENKFLRKQECVDTCITRVLGL